MPACAEIEWHFNNVNIHAYSVMRTKVCCNWKNADNKNMKHLRVFILTVFIIAELTAVYAQRNYTLVERTDLRRYDNGKYTGLVSREVRSFISASSAPSSLTVNTDYEPTDTWYDGSFYVMEQTKRNTADAAAGIHDSVPAVFRIQENGHLIMFEDNGYPSFRSFPSFPRLSVPKTGDCWTSTAERAADPLNKGKVTRMPMEVAYTLIGEETYRGIDVYRLTAKWATRYGISYTDANGDPDLKSAQGAHNAAVLVDKQTLSAILVRDSVDEQFLYKNNTVVSFKGTISLFTEYPPAVPKDKIIPALQRIACVIPADSEKNAADSETVPVNTSEWIPGVRPSGTTAVTSAVAESGENHITVEQTKAGLRLSIQDLQFKADSAELLPGENSRLDKIAEVLKLAPDSQFLVEGHTASVGNPSGELELSKERAHSIAVALAERGIKAEKFICKGFGAKKPVADNSSAEGRARNRRVEITILEP